MQPRDARVWIADARQACDVIIKYTTGADGAAIAGDVLVRSTIERQFEILGEALSRLLLQEPGLSLRLHDAREVIRFRNFLAHAYFLVDLTVVLQIAQTDVPPLRARLDELLRERGGV